ncbi:MULTISPECIES: hypothetical protein [unclassified Campylobacter]|uniref:hypothetical protein n=1 Tax=unclassified Campylobacter TaxID=2593542 RepID=UPI00123ADF2F|nr:MULTISPECIES: hypothetical protein [unclassified Campylobacter]
MRVKCLGNRKRIRKLTKEELISLKFNGKSLDIFIKNKLQHSFQAVSGKPQLENNKYYFTYKQERQMLKNEGPISESIL